MFKRWFGKETPKDHQPVVVVSGLPRSGTSMMMKMLDAGGIPVVIDGIRGADRDNPKGYYEFERVKQLDKGDTAWVADAQGKAVKVISALLQHLPADQEYRIIFMERNIDEVLASQRKMMQNRGEGGKDAGGKDAGGKDAGGNVAGSDTAGDNVAGGEDVPDAEMAALFARHVEQVEAWMAQQPNVQVLHVDYNALLADPAPFVARLHDFLPFALDTAAMTAVVDPDLYRNRRR